jgi:Txe/YoeB family toxin of toxin-antitoxin system
MEKKSKYKILLSKVAIKDKEKLDNAGLDRAYIKILDLMINDTFGYPPSYEKLVGELSGYYSRRINRQHRIVYKVLEDKKEIHIIRMWTHYE